MSVSKSDPTNSSELSHKLTSAIKAEQSFLNLAIKGIQNQDTQTIKKALSKVKEIPEMVNLMKEFEIFLNTALHDIESRFKEELTRYVMT